MYCTLVALFEKVRVIKLVCDIWMLTLTEMIIRMKCFSKINTVNLKQFDTFNLFLIINGSLM
jgi:hypothetical protein